jgi:hypothetical protein
MNDEPSRLPPPPFWRTRYFANSVMPRRPDIDPMDIRRVIARPAKKMIQPDGRIRLYGFVHGMSTYLRVVLLSDGETVHNAFPDEDFTP